MCAAPCCVRAFSLPGLSLCIFTAVKARPVPLLLLMLHCSTAATITLNDQREIHATIMDSSKEEIHLMTDTGPSTVPRAKIQDTSHPGKFHMLLGVSLFGAGLITFIAIGQLDCRDSCAQPIAGLALPMIAGAAGTGIFFWGYSAWSDSRAALVPSPAAARTDAGGGFGYRFRF